METATNRLTITYCHHWSRNYKEIYDIWSTERARQAYDKREWYHVVIGNPKRPDIFIEFSADVVNVEFLDRHLRTRKVHCFRELEPGRLFMSKAVVRQYKGKTDKITWGQIYWLKPDGYLKIETHDYVADTAEAKKSLEGDVSGCWEPYPAFGGYASIIREDRFG